MNAYVIHIQMAGSQKEIHTDDIDRWTAHLDRNNACYQVHVMGDAPVPRLQVRRYAP